MPISWCAGIEWLCEPNVFLTEHEHCRKYVESKQRALCKRLPPLKTERMRALLKICECDQMSSHLNLAIIPNRSFILRALDNFEKPFMSLFVNLKSCKNLERGSCFRVVRWISSGQQRLLRSFLFLSFIT